jgi:uncharacterized protein (TIGR03086 family)
MTERNDIVDLEPQARRVKALLGNVSDDQLTAPTPCVGRSVGDLIDHIMGFALAFRHAAEKSPLPGGPFGPQQPSAANLPPDWRDRLPDRLDELVAAWREPGAWTGMTEAGGVPMPGAVAGVVALDELLIHGWDLARGTGQPYDGDPATVEVCRAMLAQQASDHGTPGLFGPRVAVPDDAPALDRALGLSGRDPGWKP